MSAENVDCAKQVDLHQGAFRRIGKLSRDPRAWYDRHERRFSPVTAELMMVPKRNKEFGWSASTLLLAISGALLIAMGCYFLFIRPALLPEDIRYMGLTPDELEAIGPRLATWLNHVFDVMGGYVTATGVLALTLAVTAFRHRCPWAVAGSIVAGLVSIGWMTAINFMINSDFKWLLLAFALTWAASIAAFAVEARRAVR
ncbi:hypothetical protein [Bradyrhizobium japonicum]|uniref:hypothetical protein n=1 Tax=Bradyrhizobium japonicum TaxID=375 RepID=UPI0020122358|nr:hypothetical protein [Bradyrhizobium japonicum]